MSHHNHHHNHHNHHDPPPGGHDHKHNHHDKHHHDDHHKHKHEDDHKHHNGHHHHDDHKHKHEDDHKHHNKHDKHHQDDHHKHKRDDHHKHHDNGPPPPSNPDHHKHHHDDHHHKHDDHHHKHHDDHHHHKHHEDTNPPPPPPDPSIQPPQEITNPPPPPNPDDHHHHKHQDDTPPPPHPDGHHHQHPHPHPDQAHHNNNHHPPQGGHHHPQDGHPHGGHHPPPHHKHPHNDPQKGGHHHQHHPNPDPAHHNNNHYHHQPHSHGDQEDIEIIHDYTTKEKNLSCGSCLTSFAECVLSIVFLGWFFFSTIGDVQADWNLQTQLNQIYNLPPINNTDCHLSPDLTGLLIFIIFLILNLAVFFVIALWLTCYKLKFFANCRLSVKETRSIDKIDKALGIQQISEVIMSCFKVIIYMSILNKLQYCHRWQMSWFTLDDFSGIVSIFGSKTYTMPDQIGDLVKANVARTGFNVFKTYWFFQGIYFSHGNGCGLIGNTVRVLIVMLPHSILWAIKSIGDIGLFHTVQSYFIMDQNEFSITPVLVATLTNVISGALILIVVFYYNVAIIFYGERKLTKARRNSCLSRFFFFFPLLFVLYCLVTPLLLWYILPTRTDLFNIFFIMVMFSNGVLTIIILVGIFTPRWYQKVIFWAIGVEKKATQDDDENITLPRWYKTVLR